MVMIRIPGGVGEALVVSKWLKDKGYKHDQDYNWHCDCLDNTVIFVCNNQKLETMIVLKWGQDVE